MRKLEFCYVVLRCTAATVLPGRFKDRRVTSCKLLANRAISRIEREVDKTLLLKGNTPASASEPVCSVFRWGRGRDDP
jgi:hypothetical protein